MARSTREPIPVGPFLWWCHRRVAEIERECDPLFRGGVLLSDAVRDRLMMEIGWSEEHGPRRLHRWLHETPSGLVARALVEDALHHAGVDFYAVYWTMQPPRGKGGRPLGIGRRMTDAQVIAAHTVYMKGKLTVRELAELIFERYGHASAGACDVALRSAWRALALPLRTCAGVNKNGQRCGNHPRSGHDYCGTHLGRGWRWPEDLLRSARLLHERDGQSFQVVAAMVQDRTPYRSQKWIAQQLAVIAANEGWHRTQQFGQRRKHTRVRAYAQHGVAA